MCGNISKSTYSCLNSVPIEINGIISVLITRSRVKLTPTALQGYLLKMYIVVCNWATRSSENEHPEAILNYVKERVLKEIRFECIV